MELRYRLLNRKGALVSLFYSSGWVANNYFSFCGNARVEAMRLRDLQLDGSDHATGNTAQEVS